MLKLSSLSSLQLFQLIRYGTFILIGIGLVKLQLPLSDIGHFETFLLLSGMISFFWVSGIINAMLSFYHQKSETLQKEILFNTFVSLFFFSGIVAILLLFFADSLFAILDRKEEGNLIRLTTLYLLFNCPSFIIEYILFLNNRQRETIYYAVTSSILMLVAAIIPALLNYGIEFSICGLIAVALIKILYATSLLNRFALFKFNFELQTLNLKLSLPIVLSLFVSGSAEYIDGIIVKSKFDDVSFAVFRYGAKELPVLLIIANTLSTAMIPAIVRNLNEGLDELKKRSTQLMHFFFPLTIVLMLTSTYLYRFAFSESFIYSALIFNIYLLLIIPRVLFPQTILIGLQQTKFLLISSIIEIVLNVSFSLWLASKIGLSGIAFGSFIAYSADKVFLVLINHFVNKIPLSRYLKSSTFCIYSLACCITFIVAYILMRNAP